MVAGERSAETSLAREVGNGQTGYRASSSKTLQHELRGPISYLSCEFEASVRIIKQNGTTG